MVAEKFLTKKPILFCTFPKKLYLCNPIFGSSLTMFKAMPV